MSTLSKKIWTGVLIGTGAFILFGYKKVQDLSVMYDKMSFGIANISDIKFVANTITFRANIIIENNSDIAFGANLSSQISVREVRVYTIAGTYLGNAQGSISSIDIPANTATQLPKLLFVVDTLKTIQEVAQNFGQFTSGSFDSLKYEIDMNILGKTITFEA